MLVKAANGILHPLLRAHILSNFLSTFLRMFSQSFLNPRGQFFSRQFFEWDRMWASTGSSNNRTPEGLIAKKGYNDCREAKKKTSSRSSSTTMMYNT
jgi:hypothetical protein